MTRCFITLAVESGFYQEAHEDGSPMPELLKELELDIQDQLDEYDLQQTLTRLVSSKSQDDAIIFAPKKSSEEVQSPVVLFMGS